MGTIFSCIKSPKEQSSRRNPITLTDTVNHGVVGPIVQPPRQIDAIHIRNVHPSVVPHESNQVTSVMTLHKAMFDYEARTDEDLSFKKGEILGVVDVAVGDWWYAVSKSTNAEGYIPSNYVAALKSLESELLVIHYYNNKWYLYI